MTTKGYDIAKILPKVILSLGQKLTIFVPFSLILSKWRRFCLFWRQKETNAIETSIETISIETNSIETQIIILGLL
jgi:hypothetical protein